MAGVDAIVVGGGPAGSAASLTLARGGARVVVLEAAHFPRDKTCGDGVGFDALKALAALGILDEVAAVAEFGFDAVGLSGPGGERLVLSTKDRKLPGVPERTFCIPRLVLDQTLIECATRGGAQLREGVKVRHVLRDDDGRVSGVVTASGEKLTASVVIGCGGEHDPVSKAMGRPKDPRRKATALRVYFEDLEQPIPIAELSFAEYVIPGYGWVFPVSSTRANVGVGLRNDLIKKRGGDLKVMMKRFLAEDPLCREYLAGARMVDKPRGWPLTFGSQAPRTSGDGWMLCGDAACLIDPVTGEGIGPALLSGRLAAETALVGDFSAGGLLAYDRAWRKELYWSFQAAHVLQELMTRPWVVSRLMRQAGKRFELGTELAAMIGGAHPWSRAFRPGMLWRLAV